MRIVSAYRPCFSSGPLSMYQQHVRHLARIRCMDSPKDRLLTDLARAIQEWQAEGDMVIISGDMNDDIRSQKIQQAFRSSGLIEGLTTQHMLPPATHNRGSLPIDGIFLPSALLDYCESGYLEFGEAIPSDHRALWINIPTNYIRLEGKDAIE